MAHLHLSGLSPRSVTLYLSSLRFVQISQSGQDPQFSQFHRLHYVLRGLKRDQPLSSRPHRLPITPDILRALHNIWSTLPVPYNNVMLWAACLLGFFGFLRSGEFTHNPLSSSELQPADIAVDNRDNPTFITVTLRRHKTDQYGTGTTIVIGRTGDSLCPVAAILTYLAIRSSVPGPLFIKEDGSPLTRSFLVTAVREALSGVGFDVSAYSGHSFRIGAASAAAQAGLPDSMIQSMGRWKSAAFLAYIRVPTERLVSVSSALVSNPLHRSPDMGRDMG